MNTIKAIPTKYRNIQFRSRLEAQWAVFFDQVEWPWEYEPYDLAGWIPDFALKFAPATVLVECKPFLRKENGIKLFEPAMLACQEEVLMLGASIEPISTCSDCSVIGLLTEKNWFSPPTTPSLINSAVVFRCRLCKKIGLAHEQQSYHCRVCGGNDHHWQPNGPEIVNAWATAKNRSQWYGAS